MTRYQEYSTPAAVTMALSKGFRDFMNIYSQEREDERARKEKADALKLSIGKERLGVINEAGRNMELDARWQKEFDADEAYRKQTLALQTGKRDDVGFPSPEGVLGHEYLTGKIDKPTYYAELARMKAVEKKAPPEKEPPDFVNLFSNMIDKAETKYERGRNAWDQAHATDRLMGKDVPYTEEPPDVANLFKSIIEPRASRLLGPQAADSIRGEAANLFPELLVTPETDVTPDVVAKTAARSRAFMGMGTPAPVAPAQPSGDVRQKALQALQAEFGDEWNTATDAVRNAALARKIKELGG